MTTGARRWVTRGRQGHFGIPGIVAVVLGAPFWMLPRALDQQASAGWTSTAMAVALGTALFIVVFAGDT